MTKTERQIAMITDTLNTCTVADLGEAKIAKLRAELDALKNGVVMPPIAVIPNLARTVITGRTLLDSTTPLSGNRLRLARLARTVRSRKPAAPVVAPAPVVEDAPLPEMVMTGSNGNYTITPAVPTFTITPDAQAAIDTVAADLDVRRKNALLAEAGCPDKTCKARVDIKTFNMWIEDGHVVSRGQKSIKIPVDGRTIHVFCRHQIEVLKAKVYA